MRLHAIPAVALLLSAASSAFCQSGLLTGAPPPDSPLGQLIAAIPREKGCYAFAYVEPDLDGHAVRLEVLMPLDAIDRLVDVVPDGVEKVTWDERQAMRTIISDYVAPFNKVEVDGAALQLRRAEVDFFDVKNMWMPVLRDVKHENLMVGFIGIFQADAPPAKLRVEWHLFEEPPKPVQLAAMVCGAEAQFATLTQDSLSFEWSGECGRLAPREFADTKIDEALKKGFPDSLDNPAAEGIVKRLLFNAYVSFERHDEKAVRSAMATVLDEGLVDMMFKDIRTSLEDRQALGAVPRVESVSLRTGNLVQSDIDGDGVRRFKYHAAWDANGTVSHWGHGHKRSIGREAVLTVAEREGTWRIAAIDGFRIEPMKP